MTNKYDFNNEAKLIENDYISITTRTNEDNEYDNKHKNKNNVIDIFRIRLFVLKSDRRLQSLMAVLLYGIVSISQTVFNKKVITTYDFQASNVLLFCQMLFTVISMLILKYFNILSINTKLDINIVKKLMPLSVTYSINVLLGLGSLGKLNIPMYSTLKRLVALIIIVIEYIFMNKITPFNIVISVMIMVFGAILAGLSDQTYSMVGYGLVLSSCIFQAIYLILVKKIADDMSTLDMLYYNSLLSLPLTTIIMIYNQEIEYIQQFQYLHNSHFQIYFVLSVVLGFILNFCLFYCTVICSPLTTSVTGQIKNILVAVISIIIFQDLIIVPLNILGISINIMGSMYYSYLKFITTPK